MLLRRGKGGWQRGQRWRDLVSFDTAEVPLWHIDHLASRIRTLGEGRKNGTSQRLAEVLFRLTTVGSDIYRIFSVPIISSPSIIDTSVTADLLV